MSLGAMKDLAAGDSRFADDGRNRLIGIVEDLTEQENRPLRRCERLEQDQERHRHSLAALHDLGR